MVMGPDDIPLGVIRGQILLNLQNHGVSGEINISEFDL